MNEQRRQAVGRLSDLLRQENLLLDTQRYQEVPQLLAAKQAALTALEHAAATPACPDTEDDVVLARTLADLAEQNRQALQRALRVQDRIMGIMADAAKRMMETPLYGGQGTRALRRTGFAVAMVRQA